MRDPVKQREHARKYREKHKEKLSEYNKQYRKENKERIRAINRAYAERTREKRNARERERYAEKKAQEGQTTVSYNSNTRRVTSLWLQRAQLFIDDWTEYFKSKGWTQEEINNRLEDRDKLAYKLKLYWRDREGSPI